MKIILAAVNAKYIHSSPAIRSLSRYAALHGGGRADCMEFTINQHPEDILRELYLQKPDAVGFSCYIWNIGMVRRLAEELRLLLPEVLIFFGGPEVSPCPEEELRGGWCDLVLCGEGEVPFCELARRLNAGEDWRGAPSAVWLEGEALCRAPAALPVVDMGELPFLYERGLSGLRDRIIYYEASRGCPFQCQYCLSAGTDGVRLRPLAKVFSELDFFLAEKVRQVKFTDRTFNCKKSYAMAVWRHLVRHDNGVTNFHFELAAELLDEETLSFLSKARPGLFQFEIGVQSTNPETLAAVKRVTLPEKLTPIVRALREGRNIHLHLDLIAGLPFEGYERFGESFDYVYSLAPDQLQLGFLKLLKGSGLWADREKYGLVCRKNAPYEIIRTPWLSHGELLRLKMLAEMVELYYNSGRFRLEQEELLRLFPSPFRFYEALGDWYAAKGLHRAPHAKEDYHAFLWDFLLSLGRGNPERFVWLARYDLCEQEKPRRFPAWMGEGKKERYRQAIYRFFDSPENRERYLPEYVGMDTREVIRAAHIEVFPFHPLTGEEADTALLFNYRARSFSGGARVEEAVLS